MKTGIRNLAKKLKQFGALSQRDKGGLLLVFIILGLSRLIVLLLPMRFILPLLGNSNNKCMYCVCPTKHQIETARHVRRIVNIAVKNMFFKPTCLVQAIAARMLLGKQRIPYVFYLGVGLNSDKTLYAHAWVSTGPVFVTGGNGFTEYTVIATFSNKGDYMTSFAGVE